MKKSLLALAMVLTCVSSFSHVAQAADCTKSDWTIVSNALNSTAEIGEQYRREIRGMLVQEMAPSCQNLSKLVNGIPGNRYYTYLLASGESKFQVNITVGGVEQLGTKLYIEKK